MGVSDGGMPIQLEGDRSIVSVYLQKFSAISSGVNIKILSEILRNCRLADDFQSDLYVVYFAHCIH